MITSSIIQRDVVFLLVCKEKLHFTDIFIQTQLLNVWILCFPWESNSQTFDLFETQERAEWVPARNFYAVLTYGGRIITEACGKRLFEVDSRIWTLSSERDSSRLLDLLFQRSLLWRLGGMSLPYVEYLRE